MRVCPCDQHRHPSSLAFHVSSSLIWACIALRGGGQWGWGRLCVVCGLENGFWLFGIECTCTRSHRECSSHSADCAPRSCGISWPPALEVTFKYWQEPLISPSAVYLVGQIELDSAKHSYPIRSPSLFLWSSRASPSRLSVVVPQMNVFQLL